LAGNQSTCICVTYLTFFRKNRRKNLSYGFFISRIFMQQLVRILYFHFHFQMYHSVCLSLYYLLKYR
jgi:hypothetical protein